MASLVAQGAVTPAFFAANPVIGFAVLVAAAVIDSQVVYPALAGKGRSSARPPRLLDIQVGGNEPGAPRVWAIGRRVRVPTHTLWQSQKVRQSGGGSQKAGTTITQRQTLIDTLLALNDRQTVQCTQIIGNGKLLLMRTQNLRSIESSAMVVSVFLSQLILTMGSTAELDFADTFKIGDAVQLAGFVSTAGADPNVGYWKVQSVTNHRGVTPSTISLGAYAGQTVAGIAATAGTVFSPASITRVDDALFCEANLQVFTLAGDPDTVRFFADGAHLACDEVFRPGDRIVFSNSATAGFNGVYQVAFTQTDEIIARATFDVPGAGTYTAGTATSPGVLRFEVQRRFAHGFFPTTFNPDAHYFNGADDQQPSALVEADKGAGQVPAYRGVACQGLDDFLVTYFGDQLPFALEALIDPDAALTWAQAVALVLERASIPSEAIDTSGINLRPFLGFFTRGSVPGITAMQPLLLAGHLVGQERDGTICMFEIANADSVQVENDATLSDFGVQVYGQPRSDDKLQVEDTAEEDLPTSVGVRHQDPDNGYADGYQHFGLRHPQASATHQNERELDLSTLVLTRKDARNLAATHLRREWINRRRYRFVLGANYLDLLENDLVTFTDDEGNDITCRIIQRDIDSAFRVLVTAVEEDVELAVSGSPVQSGAIAVPPLLTQAAALHTVFIDAPGVANDEVGVPAIQIACCVRPGSSFAGAQVWESSNGSNWVRIGDITAQAGIGEITADFIAEDASEEYGTTTVTFRTSGIATVEFESFGPFGIEHATDEEALAGKNWCAIVAADGTVELAAFCDITFVSGNTYDLSRWLRGLRGTTPQTHVAGATIVLLHPRGGNGLLRREFAGASTPPAVAYKIVPGGLGIDDVDSVQVVAKWWNARPLPVRQVTKSIGSSPFDARFTVEDHWCRAVQPLGTQPPHPMDESFEGYRFTIYDPAGSIVKRTFDLQATPATGSTTLRDKWFDYTAAMQTADGYTPSGTETFWVDVQQIGDFGLGPSIKQEL